MSALELPAAILSQHTILLGKTGAGKSSVMRLLVESLLDEEKPVCIIDPKGDWWGLKSSASGKQAGYPVVIFGGEHADVPLNAHAGAHVAELVATGNRPCIIDLGGWHVGERTRFFIDFASTLFRTTRGPRWLVIDEIHNFAPQGKVLDIDAGKMLHWANRLASEGRGKGIQLIAASQRPQKTHKDFVTSCETLIAMRVIHPLDRNAIKDWIDGCPDIEKGKEVLSQLATMPRGTGWIWSPEIGFGPKRIAFPKFSTYDSFAAPTGETIGKLKGWAEVDLEDVRHRLASVVQEAKANDPRELRARIAELERMIKTQEFEVDSHALEQAEARGARRSAEVLASIRDHATMLRGIIVNASPLIEAIMSQATATNSPPLNVVGSVSLPKSPQAIRPAASHLSSNGTGSLPKAERLILTALAQYPQGRSITQVAILTGYSSSGGGYRNSVSSLRTKGYVEGSDRLKITSDGLEALGPYDDLPVGAKLVEHWVARLGKAERATLLAATASYPKAVPVESLASMAGYEASGGGWRNALSKLRTLELVEGRSEIRASDDLFR